MDTSALKLPCPEEWRGAGLADLTVWVDPLDGTKEYTQVIFNQRIVALLIVSLKGLLDHVTVLIGIAVGSKAVAGVIHQPYLAIRNCLFIDEQPLSGNWLGGPLNQ